MHFTTSPPPPHSHKLVYAPAVIDHMRLYPTGRKYAATNEMHLILISNNIHLTGSLGRELNLKVNECIYAQAVLKDM